MENQHTANMKNHNYKGDPAGSMATTTCPLEPCPIIDSADGANPNICDPAREA